MQSTDTLILGAGQAGLAASRCLTDRGHDHVVLERARIGQRWRGGVWDSLHLLTPNWLNALPGRPYRGPDPDTFARAGEFADDLVDYAQSFKAPVVEHAPVRRLQRSSGRFTVTTDAGAWRAGTVVIATGWCDQPSVPGLARGLAVDIHQITPDVYRQPGALASGGVLVVGASATGVQIADELAAAGRAVTLAVGRHTRLPRTYRGRDIYWWLHRLGHLDKTIDEMPDRELARREPSAQLVGRPDRRTVDLTTLRDAGVQLAGRVIGADGHRVWFAPDLPATMAAAEARLRRLLGRIDEHAGGPGSAAPQATAPPVVSDLDLRAAGITTVLWATGHRRSYPWLTLPGVLDRRGEIRQQRGHTPVPGLYVLGQRFQHRRDSHFIGGVGRDAAAVADHITKGE
jgi:putative flavoprotein involved in K+ transport